jgi:hypothetical protein
MEIINFFNCYDHYEARQKEQEYFISLNATLNSVEPMPKPKEKPQPIITPIKTEELIYNESNTNAELLMNPNIITSENHQGFDCSICDFQCCKKGDYNRHLMTLRHQRLTNPNNFTSETNDRVYNCNCGKTYKHMSSLCAHKKSCNPEEIVNNADTSLIVQLMKQNNEFKHMLVEQNKAILEQNNKVFESQHQLIEMCKQNASSITNSNINSNNKTFNLQVFLNEDCKDAMNITDFVNSINLQLSDLEHVGKVGYVEGISNIIIKNLNALDVTKRPVHCTDPKRETIYIKDGDVWEKDEDDNKKLRKMIKSVAFRNCKNTRLFKEKYPDCMKSESKYSDMYNKIIIEVMGGDPKINDIENQNKIMRKIAKVMTIDKSNPLL